jgi:hypothetical protein
VLIRFVGSRRDNSSGRREGIFQLARRLRLSGELAEIDDERLAEIGQWFNENLRKPRRFARSQNSHPQAVAISWFKSDARDHIARIREMQSILEAYGLLTEMIKTDRPGYVVYEDEHQVTAFPFRDTQT